MPNGQVWSPSLLFRAVMRALFFESLHPCCCMWRPRAWCRLWDG